MLKNRIQYFYIIVGIFFLLPIKIMAADGFMFLSSGAGAYYSSRDLNARLVVNSGGIPGINAAEGVIKFNPKEIKVKKITKDKSIFELWPVEPKFSNTDGTIKFAGGTTKSFKDSAGVIFNIVFTPLKSGNIDLGLATVTASVLSADGKAKNILKEADGGTYIFGNSAVVNDAEKLRNKMNGRILLQVEKDGRSWYVYPDDRRRYYLGRPLDAFNIMRKLGLGAAHKFILKYKDKTFPKEMSGKILLDVEANGEAFYVNPVDLKGYYLGRPADAFAIMRKLGLGITNGLIRKIPDWAI